MTLTLELPPDVESRLHALSAQSGQKPEEYLIGLVREKPLAEEAAERAELDALWDDYHARFGHEPGPTSEELLALFRQNVDDFAAGRWFNLEELDAAMRLPVTAASRDKWIEKSEHDMAVTGIRRGIADAAAGREISLEDYRAEIALERAKGR